MSEQGQGPEIPDMEIRGESMVFFTQQLEEAIAREDKAAIEEYKIKIILNTSKENASRILQKAAEGKPDWVQELLDY